LEVIDKLITAIDVVAVTTYGINSSFHAVPPSTVNETWEGIVAAADEKYIIMQECGYPSGTDLYRS
jgi:hypothetical protein